MKKDVFELSGLPPGVKVYLKTNPMGQILKDKGLTANGSVQSFHTNNVLRKIIKYMPYRTSATIKLTIAQTDINSRYIVTDVPYGKYLYYGKVMVGVHSGSAWARENEPKKVINKNLEYTKIKHPQAGPFWDRALSAAEGPALAADLQRYIRSRR